MAMTIPEILKAFEPYTGQFPMEAMREAVAQREAITPELLRLVETVAEDPLKNAEREDSMLPFFAVFLCGQPQAMALAARRSSSMKTARGFSAER